MRRMPSRSSGGSEVEDRVDGRVEDWDRSLFGDPDGANVTGMAAVLCGAEISDCR